MAAAALLLAVLALLASVHAQTILPITSYPTYQTLFPTSQSQNVYISLDAAPCSASSCSAGTCTHLYCGTDSTGACQNNVDETFSVGLQLSLNIVCCTGTDISTCGVPASCGGNIALTGSQIQAIGTGLSLTGPFGTCNSIPSNPGWAAVGTISAASIQAVCSNTGPLKPYWMPLIGQSTFPQCQLPNSAVQLSISNSNNVFDPLYFNVGIGFGQSTPTTSPTPTSGPSAGVVQSPYNCASASGTAAPSPSVPPSLSACAGTCGCYFIDMLNRTYTGGTSPTTTFYFEVCVLCSAGFSYLAICDASQGSAIITSLGGSNSYTGSLCTYQIGTGSGQLTGCTTIKYQNPSCGSNSFLGGACDIFPVTVAGDVSDYNFQFFGHAGGGTTLYPININTGTCTCGTNCAVPATTQPVPTTTPPPPTTTPPAPTTPIPTDVNGTTLYPPPTTPAPTSPLPTTTAPATTAPATTAPAPTTPNGCLKGSNLCDSATGTCDTCCYPAGGAIVAWCVPNGAGGYNLQLVPTGETPPSGSFPPNSTATDGSGYNVDCGCNKIVVSCPACTGGNCLCDSATGVCYSDPVCSVTPSPTNPGQTCAACPVDANGLSCGGNGLCQCNGTCVCSSTAINGVVYGGVACNIPQGCSALSTCSACLSDPSCVWCNQGGSTSCTSTAVCSNLQGYSEDCNGIATLVVPSCPNNCSCNGQSQGQCVVSQGITQCQCNSGQHGADCCTGGGLSVAAKAGIAAGVVAGIVLACVIGAAVLGFGVKKGVDWVQLRNTNMAAANDNPMFKPQTEERENPLHVQKGDVV